MCWWKPKHSQSFADVFFDPRCEFGSGLLVFQHDTFQLGIGRLLVGRVENAFDVLGDLPLDLVVGRVLQGVVLEVKLAALPRDTGEASLSRFGHSRMRIAADQF